MDIYMLIRQDHQQIKKLIDRINQLPEARFPDRFLIYRQLKDFLMIHMMTENHVFYAKLKEHPKLKSIIRNSQIEHDEISQMLDTLSDTTLPAYTWSRKFAELQNALLHHILKEESEIFTYAHAMLSREGAADLAVKMDMYRQQLLPRKAG